MKSPLTRVTRYLSMPLVLLLGYDPKIAPSFGEVLPDNLESFKCTDDMATFDTWKWTSEEQLRKTIDYVVGEPRALQSITLSIRESFYESFEETALAEWRSACEKVGVQCRVRIIPDE